MQTERLILRNWQDEDYPAFVALNACERVMQFFPDKLQPAASIAMADSLREHIALNGWGLWALEERDSGQFIGFTGLQATPHNLPCSPATEVGWRLARQFWGKGYATEAASAALAFAFHELQLNEVVSFTSILNSPSERVMRRIGMTNTHQNFNHPSLDPSDRLSEHVLYRTDDAHWRLRDGKR